MSEDDAAGGRRPWLLDGDDERARLLAARRASSGSGSGGASDGPAAERVRMVLDTDAFNEIDDQFALVHALLSPDRVNLEAVYAAPFHNERSSGPGDGMGKSLQEIERVLAATGAASPPALAGATEWMTGRDFPAASAAVDDLAERTATSQDHGGAPLYVVAIGAPTNIANALALHPEIARHIVVVWLGGNSWHWPTASEFNLYQDPAASRLLLDSGVALVHVPCRNVADHLITTGAEVERYVRPAGAIGELLADRYLEHVAERVGRSKVIWDLAAVSWVLDPSWSTTVWRTSPRLTTELTWSHDPRRHLIAEMIAVDRDAVFADLFERLGRHARLG